MIKDLAEQKKIETKMLAEGRLVRIGEFPPKPLRGQGYKVQYREGLAESEDRGINAKSVRPPPSPKCRLN